VPTPELHDAEYFNEHPEELPLEQEWLDKLMAGESIPVAADIALMAPATESSDAGDADATGEVPQGDAGVRRIPTAAKPDDKKADDKKADEKGGVVETADGKGRIPYAVLKGAREKADIEAEGRIAAEQRATQAEAQAAELRSRIATLEKTDKPEGKAAQKEADTLKDEIEALKEDLPGMAGILDKLLARTEAAEERSRRLEVIADKDAKDEQTVAVEYSQQRIDANPDLALWQNTSHNDPNALKAFQAAYDVDETLRKDPYWSKQSLDDRFNKVVKEVRERIPDAPVPETGDGKDGKQSSAEVAAAVAKAKARADSSGRGTVTLSDAKGGTPPAPDQLGDIESLSPAELEVYLEKLTPAQQEEFLSRF
jgi:hypothetical protein